MRSCNEERFSDHAHWQADEMQRTHTLCVPRWCRFNTSSRSVLLDTANGSFVLREGCSRSTPRGQVR